jgi:hypothetical protein
MSKSSVIKIHSEHLLCLRCYKLTATLVVYRAGWICDNCLRLDDGQTRRIEYV